MESTSPVATLAQDIANELTSLAHAVRTNPYEGIDYIAISTGITAQLRELYSLTGEA